MSPSHRSRHTLVLAWKSCTIKPTAARPFSCIKVQSIALYIREQNVSPRSPPPPINGVPTHPRSLASEFVCCCSSRVLPREAAVNAAGNERKRKAYERQVEAKSSLRFDPSEFDNMRVSAADSCKDVDCSTSGMSSGGVGNHRAGTSRVRWLVDDSFVSEGVSSAFEFQKTGRAPPLPHRLMAAAAATVPPFSKPLPSKWDDAQKWIASPTSNRGVTRSGAWQSKKEVSARYGGGRHAVPPATKVVLEVEEVDTKRMDHGNQATKDVSGMNALSWAPEPCGMLDASAQPPLLAEKSVADSAVHILRHEATSVCSTATFITPATTVRSVSMRDMGTEMTPLMSQEPSRTGTPVRGTSPLCSPTSQTPTPQRLALSVMQNELTDCCENPMSNLESSAKELKLKTRKEIMVLGQQLGKLNITAWATMEEEETHASTSIKSALQDQIPKDGSETRAAAWEEAEKTKYLTRFNREEIKIQAWENHQKAQNEAEMRRIEVEVERMRARAHERLMNQLAAAKHKAEKKRAAAEAKRNRQAAKTAQQAEYIRRTGRLPSSLSCRTWCS